MNWNNMILIECYKCKIEDLEVYVNFPEDGNPETQIWIERTINNKVIYFCEECGENLEDLENKSLESVLFNFIQPERSKRENLIECYRLYEANPYRTFIGIVDSKKEAMDWIGEIGQKELRSYKKVYLNRDAVL